MKVFKIKICGDYPMPMDSSELREGLLLTTDLLGSVRGLMVSNPAEFVQHCKRFGLTSLQMMNISDVDFFKLNIMMFEIFEDLICKGQLPHDADFDRISLGSLDSAEGVFPSLDSFRDRVSRDFSGFSDGTI